MTEQTPEQETRELEELRDRYNNLSNEVFFVLGFELYIDDGEDSPYNRAIKDTGLAGDWKNMSFIEKKKAYEAGIAVWRDWLML